MDERLALLTAWVRWQRGEGGQSVSLQSVSGDASFRRYFRFSQNGSTFIAVDAPPDKEDNPAFISLSNFLIHHGVRCPEVLASDLTQGFLLLEDFGDQLLLPKLDQGSVDQHYAEALGVLLKMQQIDCNADESLLGYSMPFYSQPALRAELDLFPEWFLEAYLGMTLSPDERGLLSDAFETLEQSALSQPQVFVHRDFHARNIMLLDDGDLGIIDFQDGVLGPVSYDLVSLLRDCYIRWPLAQTNAWVEDYWRGVKTRGLIDDSVDFKQFLKWFDWMGLQRHLKVAGIFARLCLRDGKPAYLADVPRVMSYILDVAWQYDELNALQAFLSARVLPLYVEKYPQAQSELESLRE